MQLGAVLVFDTGPLQLRNGGVDVEQIRAYTAERLSELPELSAARGQGFSLDYHVRHASLPRPGDERALKRLAARVFSQALDPGKPLWELWVVEGLDERRFALIAKLDGALFEPARGVVASALAALSPSGLLASLLGGRTAPAHLRIDWLPLDAADVAAVCNRLGAREGDVILAALAGGLRRLFERRGGGAVGRAYASTPLCVANGRAAPRIRLPLDEPEPRARLGLVRAARERVTAPEPTASPLAALARLARAAASSPRADVVLAELAAPAGALLGARLRAAVPILPPPMGGTLGVTATRSGDCIFLGLSADAVLMPDLSALADGVAASFDELRKLAAAKKPAAARRPRARRPPARPRAEPEAR